MAVAKRLVWVTLILSTTLIVWNLQVTNNGALLKPNRREWLHTQVQQLRQSTLPATQSSFRYGLTQTISDRLSVHYRQSNGGSDKPKYTFVESAAVSSHLTERMMTNFNYPLSSGGDREALTNKGYGDIDYVTLAYMPEIDRPFKIHAKEGKVNLYRPRKNPIMHDELEARTLPDRFDELVHLNLLHYDDKGSTTAHVNIVTSRNEDKLPDDASHSTARYLSSKPLTKKTGKFGLSSIKDQFMKNPLIKDYVNKMKESYDELFYTIHPIRFGVPETEDQGIDNTIADNKHESVVRDDSTFGRISQKANKTYSLPGCNCSRDLPVVTEQPEYIILRRTDDKRLLYRRVSLVSTCGDLSTARGPGQKVVSYSYFGRASNPGVYQRYFSEIQNRAKEIQQHYPGMVMRVYHNVGPDDQLAQGEMCQAFCSFPHLDFCDVSSLPPPWLNFGSEQKVGTLWRFLPLTDPLVDVALVRDLDSYLLKREVDAVLEWLKTDIPYHAMRDHPLHNTHIMAGLWGSHTSLDRAEAYHYTVIMLSQPYNDLWDYDQRLLRRVLWPGIKDKTMSHDSYSCRAKEFHGRHPSRPFPTQREGRNYTGFGKTKLASAKLLTPCPLFCRPQNHKEWRFC